MLGRPVGSTKAAKARALAAQDPKQAKLILVSSLRLARCVAASSHFSHSCTGHPSPLLLDHLAALPLLLQKFQLVLILNPGGDSDLEMARHEGHAPNPQRADLANGNGTLTKTTRRS
jgi:hypothetical protein